jgi:hypothetical protein
LLATARRIAQLRDYYFDHAPELAGYLLNPAESLPTPGLGIGLWQQFVTLAGMVAVITAVLGIGLWQQFVTLAGMVAVITAVLAGSAGGLLAAVASGHSLVAALVAGVVVAAADVRLARAAAEPPRPSPAPAPVPQLRRLGARR